MSIRGRRGCDGMVVGFTTTCAISGYHHYSCEFEPRSWRGVLDTTLCATVCQWLAKGFSPGTPVSSTNKSNHHDITEMLLKVALKTIHLNVNTMIWTIYPYMFDLFETVSISELKWASYYPFGIFTLFFHMLVLFVQDELTGFGNKVHHILDRTAYKTGKACSERA